MARLIPSLPMQNFSFSSTPVSFFFILIAIFSLFGIVTFLCASHKTKKSHRKEEENHSQSSDNKSVSKLNSNITGKALLMVKMISWRKVQVEVEGEEQDDSDEAVWRKTIMMGERCRPLNFSGKILYDSEGHLLPNSPHRKQNNNLVALGKC